MAFKHVHSKNPLKRAIQAALRWEHGVISGRVTCVQYDAQTSTARGRVFQPGRAGLVIAAETFIDWRDDVERAADAADAADYACEGDR